MWNSKLSRKFGQEEGKSDKKYSQEYRNGEQKRKKKKCLRQNYIFQL